MIRFFPPQVFSLVDRDQDGQMDGVRTHPGRLSALRVFPSKLVLDALLHGRAGCLTAKNGGFWPGQNEFEFYGVGEALAKMRERDMDGDGVRTHG
jgi:hypothetical protein